MIDLIVSKSQLTHFLCLVLEVYFEDCNAVKTGECHIIHQQQFGEVEYTEGKAFQWGKYDGIIGLGFPKLAIDGTVPPFGEL
jgi:hypothetical protein